MTHLRIYGDALRLVAESRPLWEKLAARGFPELARQLRRSAPAVALNIAEGTGRYDGNGRQRFETAIGEAHEVKATLDVGVATRALTKAQVAEAWDRADKVAATLFRMTRRRVG